MADTMTATEALNWRPRWEKEVRLRERELLLKVLKGSDLDRLSYCVNRIHGIGILELLLWGRYDNRHCELLPHWFHRLQRIARRIKNESIKTEEPHMRVDYSEN